MAYDGLGRRVQLISGGATTKYHYDSTGRLIAISDGSGNWSETIWLGDLPVAQASGSNLYAIHSDQVGQPVKMSNAAGALVWQRTAQPFGETYAESGSIATVLRFPGQVADAATATHYNMARDYDPSLGRYLQSDPIGLAGGWNTYAYVGGNPVSRVDPEGLDYMARPDHWFTSGPFGIIAYVRDQVVPAMTGEKVCIDYDGMARDLALTAAGGFAGGYLLKSTYDGARRFGSWLTRKGGRAGAKVRQLDAIAGDTIVYATTPVGRRGNPIIVKRGTNADGLIGGRQFSGHSLDQMQGRGIMPSAVENTIRIGRATSDPIPGRIRHYDATNDLTVVTESNGRVVTVITGKR